MVKDATYRVKGPELTTIYGQPGSPDPVLRQTASVTFTQGRGGSGTQAWHASGWNSPSLDNTDHFQFDVSTAGKSNIIVEFYYRRSNTGPTNYEVRYSTDSINFTTGCTGTLTGTDWSTQQICNLSAVSNLDSNLDAKFRISAWGADTSVGTLRIDDVEIGDNGTLAVRLAHFTVTPTHNHVLVTWETASELNNLGFNLYRAEALEGRRIRLNPALIPSQAPGSGQGFSYSYRDDAVQRGRTYWYWLEDLDLNGARTLHGPATAIVPPFPTYLPLIRLDAWR